MCRGWRSQYTTNVFLVQDFVYRLKTLMVAERYLSAPSAWEPPTDPSPRQAMAAASINADMDAAYVPTLIADYPDPGE